MLKNSARARSDMSYYRTEDSYSMAERLRKLKEKHRNYGLPKASESQSILDESQEVDDDEELQSNSLMDSFFNVTVLLAHRVTRTAAWIFGKVPYLPEQFRRLRLQDMLPRLNRVGIGTDELPLLLEQYFCSVILLDPGEPVEGNEHLFRTFQIRKSDSQNNIYTQYRYEYRDQFIFDLDIVDFGMEESGRSEETFLSEFKDFRAITLHPNCAAVIWIVKGRTRIILFYDLTDPTWSDVRRFRQILADIASIDSIIINHSHYWHPVLRMKLKRAVRLMKRLYSYAYRRERKALRDKMDPISSNNPGSPRTVASVIPTNFRFHLQKYVDLKECRSGAYTNLDDQTQILISAEGNKDKLDDISALVAQVTDHWSRYYHLYVSKYSSDIEVNPGPSVAWLEDENEEATAGCPPNSGINSRKPVTTKPKPGFPRRVPPNQRKKFKIKHNDNPRAGTMSNLREMNEGLRNGPPRVSTSAYTYSEAARNIADNELPVQSLSDTPLSSSRTYNDDRVNSTTSSEWGDQQELQSEKLGLTRTRHSSSHVTVNQDLLPGPPVFNFNEPNGMPGVAVQVTTHFQGFPDVPPADADTFHHLMPIQPRQFSTSNDNLSGVVNQLGLETGPGHVGHSHGHLDLQPHRHGSGPSFHHPQSNRYEISQNKCLDSLDLGSSSNSRYSYKGSHKAPVPPPENGDGF